MNCLASGVMIFDNVGLDKIKLAALTTDVIDWTMVDEVKEGGGGGGRGGVLLTKYIDFKQFKQFEQFEQFVWTVCILNEKKKKFLEWMNENDKLIFLVDFIGYKW